jgi:hypothetical protein
MSVPGRIGIVLIIALALVDACILASGARKAATDIQTHSMISPAGIQVESPDHETLISAAIRQINLLKARAADRISGA